MRCLLAGLMILLLVAVAGAETPPAGDRPVSASSELARTLALLDQVDPQTLPTDQRRTLYFALADALLADGQPERALTFLARVGQIPATDVAAQTGEQISTRLEQVASPVLMTALQAGSSLAPLLRAELARRGEPLPASGRREQAIGVLLPLSGRHAPYGLAVQQGLELARAALSPDHPVRFVYRDTAAEGGAVSAMLTELAQQEELLAVIGPLLSSDAAAAAAQAEQERIPLLLLAPREGVTGGYVFRNALTVADQVQTLADFAGGERLQRFAILHPATRHGELCADQFQAVVERQGGQIVARQSYPAGTFDLRQQLQALATAARRGGGGPPDALFLPDDAQQVAQIIPQLGFARLELLQLLGINAWNDPELGRMAGPSSEGAVFVDGFFVGSPWPEVGDFVARFRAAYGIPPNILNAQGYDAGRIMMTLLARPDVQDRAVLRQALGALRNFPGVTGRTGFGANGEAMKTLFLLQVQDGTVVQIN